MRHISRRSLLGAALAGGLALGVPRRGVGAAPAERPIGANGDIRVAVIGLGQLGGPGVGARGHQLIDLLRKTPGVRVVALCDVDQQILGRELERFAGWKESIKSYADMRAIFDAPDVDAVCIATPNHWHALATIWACQAGKDVYVEKPASHDLWEGGQMVAAARKHGRIVQVGTQARSSDALWQAVEFVRGGQLGKIRYIQALVYRRREGIGKVSGPQSVPSSVDYDQWLGPAPHAPLMRQVFHYDWHWFWDTGNGEIGNNGVHYLDRSRWFLGDPGLPHRAVSVGGRFAFDDDGQTPNTAVALLDCEPAPILCEVRGLPEKAGSKKMEALRGLTTGIVVHCEGGCITEGAGGVAALDHDGRRIAAFADRRPAEEQEIAHQANFIGAVRSRKSADLNADILVGHHSAALCHVANTSYRLGQASTVQTVAESIADSAPLSEAWERLVRHLAGNEVDLTKTPVTLGPWLAIDRDTERFVGNRADEANRLSRRAYRPPYNL